MLLQRWNELGLEIKALTEKREEIRKAIGDLPLGPGIIDDDYRIIVTETRRFSPKLAKDLLTDEEYAKILVTKPDSALAKRKLSPEDYEALMAVSGQTWTAKERNDV